MSTKNNAMVSAVALALGVVVAADALPICEGLINDLNVTEFGAAEVDGTGRCMVIVSIFDGTVTAVRPVADNTGNVRLYGDANAAMALAKRANIAAGTKVKFVKFVSTAAVGDPVAALKSKYKRFKNELAASVDKDGVVSTKLAAGLALGWDVANGTPEHAEYVDLQTRAASIAEWKTYNDEKVKALAGSLTAAGVDPLTVV